MNQPISGGGRIYMWDNLKFALLVLVSIGHFVAENMDESKIFEMIFLFIYAFHMPLFIFVAGHFHSDKEIPRKALFYFLVFLFIKIVYAATDVAEGYPFKLSLLSTPGLPWFMFFMMVAVVVTYLLRNTNKVVALFICVVISLVAGYFPFIRDFLVLSRIIVYYPYYLLGNIFRDKDFFKEICNNRKPLLGLVIILGWALSCYILYRPIVAVGHLFTGRNPYGSHLIGPAFLYRLAIYFMNLVIGWALIQITPRRDLGIITVMGGRTINSYFWHRIILWFMVYMGLNTIINVSPLGKLFWIILAVVVAFISSTKLFTFPIENIRLLVFRKSN